MTFYDAQVNLEEPAEDFGVGYHILYIKSPLRRKVLGVEGPQRTSGPMFSTLTASSPYWSTLRPEDSLYTIKSLKSAGWGLGI